MVSAWYPRVSAPLSFAARTSLLWPFYPDPNHNTAHRDILWGRCALSDPPYARAWALHRSIVIVLGVLFGIPALLVMAMQNDHSFGTTMFAVSSLCVFLAVPMSIYDIHQHLAHFWQPVLQTYVIRILWMIPVYGLCAWTALLLWYTDQVRACVWCEPSVYEVCSVRFEPALSSVARARVSV